MDTALYRNTSVKSLREALEKHKHISLTHTGSFTLNTQQAAQKNCENMIGAAQIPLGIAGPISIKSQNQKIKISDIFIPLATTEGALIASVNRGCKAIEQSKDTAALVDSELVGTTRGSVFKFQMNNHLPKFTIKQWIDVHFKQLQKITKTTSSHATLINYDVALVGLVVYIRWYFDTQDAMGMNMATFAATALNQYIEKETGLCCVAVAGNFDVDKKPSWLNFLQGRGRKVHAEVVLAETTVKSILKTTANNIVEVVHLKQQMGSIMSGSMGFNGHYANMVAALYAATGQDLAHVVEGSLGVTTAHSLENGDLYFSIFLPAVMVGTVGGGTNLETQKEALKLLGISGGNKGKNAELLALILGATVLAGELSLTASLAEGTLAAAHKRLAR